MSDNNRPLFLEPLGRSVRTRIESPAGNGTISLQPHEALIIRLLSALRHERPLTNEEYQELLNLSQDHLSTVIASLYDNGETKTNFFDLTVTHEFIDDDPNFIETGEDYEIDPDDNNFPILSYALRLSDIAFATRMLEIFYSPQYHDAEESVRIIDNLGQTPLHLAAWLGEYEICDLLIRIGADVSAVNGAGSSILPQILFRATLDHLEESNSLRIRDLLLDNDTQYIINRNRIDTGDLSLPSMEAAL